MPKPDISFCFPVLNTRSTEPIVQKTDGGGGGASGAGAGSAGACAGGAGDEPAYLTAPGSACGCCPAWERGRCKGCNITGMVPVEKKQDRDEGTRMKE